MSMNRINYQKELEKILEKEETKGKTLLLHSCCAPCSSYVLEYLHRYFRITVFYYNPNISEDAEYRHRVKEQKRLIGALNEERQKDPETGYPIQFLEGNYDKAAFFAMAKGLENCPEGGERCFGCYELRLREAAVMAKQGNFDYFTTTLTISPMKNAEKLNEIGQKMADEYGVTLLPSDFKKKNGYRRSVELSAEYQLYRQDYCGCIFSRMERDKRVREKEQTADSLDLDSK